MATATNDIYTVNNGRARVRLHPGQVRAWDSTARFVWVIAGTQSGKTTFGPWWLDEEIRRRGAGDYLAVTSSYDLFKLKMLPQMRAIFGGLFGWAYNGSDKTLTSPDGDKRIILRSAAAEAGLESATAKAAWLDECGQDDFRVTAWEAVQRRLSLHSGRVLGTTTPYNLGWLKTQVFDRWTAGDPDYDVIQFKSTQNPAFPVEEYERARATLPGWKFRMFYQGEFTRPAGLIYDNFDTATQIIDPFTIPDDWPRFAGLDFGGVNTAAVLLAENPDSGAIYVIDEYHAGARTAAQHTAHLGDWRARYWAGGAKSEGQWRQEFRAAGLPVAVPLVSDVEVGIDRVYALLPRLFVFRDCRRLVDELGTYSRELDASGQPTIKIRNKNEYHMLDALRYIAGYLQNRRGFIL